MSRKNPRAAKTMPTARPPRSAVHRRRNRAIRHLRPAVSAHSASATPGIVRFSHPHRALTRQDFLHWLMSFLLGTAISATFAGIGLGPAAALASPYAPATNAQHVLFPAAILAAFVIARVGPDMLRKGIPQLRERDVSMIPPVALIIGIFVLSLPAVFTVLLWLNDWMHLRFVLSNLFLRVAQLGVMGPLCLLSALGFLEIGALVRHRVRDLPKWESAFCIGLGLAMGLAVASILSSKPALILPAASLPLLFITLITASFVPPIRSAPEKINLDPI